MVRAWVAAALLWSFCGGLESAPSLPPEGHKISTRMIDSPKKCLADADCGDAELLTCDLETKLCKCREKYSVLGDGGRCLPAKQLGEACELAEQCRVLEKNATCNEDKFCACDSGFYSLHDNGTLCSPSMGGAEETARSQVDINMIIVLSVLAIMFIGICVALHLFSKARFRNRRTIFNSPHPRLMHVKLGKRKKSSVRTHHLPPPPPPPHLLAGRHHSFSGYHSPYTAHKVSKTRSHECLRSAAMSRPTSPKFEPRPKTAPLAEKESLPSSEDLEKKTPEPLQNGAPGFLGEEESQPRAPGSPTVIITDSEGAHTVVTTNPPTPGSAVHV